MSTRNENGAIRQTNNGAGEVEASIMKNEEDLRDMLDDVQHRVLAKLFSLFAQKADDVDSIGPDNYFEATDDEKAKLRSVASAIFQGICTVTGGVICIDINSMGTRRKTIVMDLLCKELHPSSSLDGVSPAQATPIQTFVYHHHAWKHAPLLVGADCYYEASISVSLIKPAGPCETKDIILRLFPVLMRAEMSPPGTPTTRLSTVVQCSQSCNDASSRGLSGPILAQKELDELNIDIHHQKTRDVLGHLVAKFSGATSKDLSLVRDAIYSERRLYIQVQSLKQAPEPIYYGNRLYTTHRRVEYLGKGISEFGTTWISPSMLLWSDYPQLPRIRILSMDARWVTPVLNEIIRGRMANENPEAYFERGSTIAKNLIEKFLDGEEPPSETETCENNLGDFQACPKCLEVVRSRSLRSIGDSKMCLFCCTGSREILGPTQTTRSGLNTMEKVLLFKIYGSFKGDENKGMTAPRDQEDRLRLASIVWEELEKDRRVPGQAHEDPPRYEDTYVKQVVQRHSMRGQRYGTGKFTARLNPFQLSLDGIHPWAVSPEGVKGYHVQGNLAVTTISLNTLKYIYPAVVLCALAAFRAATTRDQKSAAFVGIVNVSILAACFGLCESSRVRLAQEMDNDSVRKMHEACSTGRLPDDMRHLLRAPKRHPYKLWSSDRARTDHKFKPLQGVELQCAVASCREGWPCDLCRRTEYRHPRRDYRQDQFLQIAESYGYSKDDEHLWTIEDACGNKVFYPFALDSKKLVSGVWTEFTCDIWFQMRHLRMEVWCNVINDHEDGMDEELLMFIALRSRLNRLRQGNDGTARDVAGLEPVPFINTPITASFARKRHGPSDGFNSGYTRKPPQSQSEDFSPELNNCELDCKVTNWACADWFPDHWDTIFAQLDNLRNDCPFLRPHPDMFKDFYVLPTDDIQPDTCGRIDCEDVQD